MPDKGWKQGQLSNREKIFIAEYLVDLDPKRAALKAGYSAAVAYAASYSWVGNPRVKPDVYKAVEKAMAKRAEKVGITAERVLQELAKIGLATTADVTNWGVKEVAIGFTEDGKRLPSDQIGDAVVIHYVNEPFVAPIDRDDLPEEIRAAVAEVSLGPSGFKIKMHDKVQALTQMGRHLGMFTDKHEHIGVIGITISKDDDNL